MRARRSEERTRLPFKPDDVRAMLLNIAYSNLWTAMAAAGGVRVTQVLLGMPLDPRTPFLAFATMFMVYTFAKTIHFDPVADALNDPERTAFLLRLRRPLVVFAGTLYIIALALAWRAGLLTWCILPFLTALAYDLRLGPSRWRYRRLKDIPGGKSLVVAVTWALTCVWLPVSTLAVPPAGTACVMTWQALLWFTNTVFFDMGDMEGDRAEGTVTLPLILGFPRCRLLLLGTSLLAWLLLARGAAAGVVTNAAAWANAVSLYTFAYVFVVREEGDEMGFLCDVVADGTFVMGALLLALGGLLALA